MQTMTIQTAMADLKTLKKRIDARCAESISTAQRASWVGDLFEHQGGAKEAHRVARQAVSDLWRRHMNLRLAIQRTNVSKTLTVAGTTRTIAEWLIWRKDIKDQHRALLVNIRAATESVRKEAERTPLPSGGTGTVVLHYVAKDLTDELDAVERTVGELDGALSQFNATETVEVAD